MGSVIREDKLRYGGSDMLVGDLYRMWVRMNVNLRSINPFKGFRERASNEIGRVGIESEEWTKTCDKEVDLIAAIGGFRRIRAHCLPSVVTVWQKNWASYIEVSIWKLCVFALKYPAMRVDHVANLS